MCINRTCVSTNILEYYCRDEKCNGQGICNSNGNCHCDFGWAPPYCTEKGSGGSLDSGPPPSTSTTSSNTFLIGIIIGSVILLLLITIAVCSIACRFRRSGQKSRTSKKKPDSSASVGKGSQK
ncbi:disintegrin and metalloproteinase domain-containing protein 30-like [Alligator mississippiensis]|uniref:disintegrin and metalloproteinase domain-containing protein 30-like n=1 Tax=Alligator mississippiensis TaxID=8496 RepID=UPI002877581C|nr:disintegrin and metalloproteinase domain-containing protein 30-like [Alligator mississippiensis]